MGISGVNGIGGMQDYSIQAPDYSRQPAKTVITEVPQQESRVASSNQIDSSPAENTQAAEKKPSANAALEDISITFHKQDDFDTSAETAISIPWMWRRRSPICVRTRSYSSTSTLWEAKRYLQNSYLRLSGVSMTPEVFFNFFGRSDTDRKNRFRQVPAG